LRPECLAAGLVATVLGLQRALRPGKGVRCDLLVQRPGLRGGSSDVPAVHGEFGHLMTDAVGLGRVQRRLLSPRGEKPRRSALERVGPAGRLEVALARLVRATPGHLREQRGVEDHVVGELADVPRAARRWQADLVRPDRDDQRVRLVQRPCEQVQWFGFGHVRGSLTLSFVGARLWSRPSRDFGGQVACSWEWWGWDALGPTWSAA